MRKNLILGIVLIIGIFILVIFTKNSSNYPNISWIKSENLENIEGKKQNLSEITGNKYTIINFWATWCAPCVEEMPMLSKFHQRNKDDGISVIGLAIDRKENVKKFLRKLKVDHHIIVTGAKGTKIMEKIGFNESNSLPFTVLIDANYNILEIKLGKLTLDELLYWVNTAER